MTHIPFAVYHPKLLSPFPNRTSQVLACEYVSLGGHTQLRARDRVLRRAAPDTPGEERGGGRIRRSYYGPQVWSRQAVVLDAMDASGKFTYTHDSEVVPNCHGGRDARKHTHGMSTPEMLERFALLCPAVCDTNASRSRSPGEAKRAE